MWDDTFGKVVIYAGAILGIILLSGLVAGQFRRGVIEELRLALAAAKTENDLLTGRLDRAERDIAGLTREVAGLHSENQTLRSVLAGGEQYAAILKALDSLHQDNLSTAALLEGRNRAQRKGDAEGNP